MACFPFPQLAGALSPVPSVSSPAGYLRQAGMTVALAWEQPGLQSPWEQPGGQAPALPSLPVALTQPRRSSATCLSLFRVLFNVGVMAHPWCGACLSSKRPALCRHVISTRLLYRPRLFGPSVVCEGAEQIKIPQD